MTMLELIEELVAVNVLGVTAETGDEETLRAIRAEVLDVEIRRRLAAVNDHHGTEASKIRLILDGAA